MKFDLKITVLLSGLMVSTFVLHAQEANFSLTLKIAHVVPAYKAFLLYRSGPESMALDSATNIDGRFEFKGKTLRPQKAVLFLAPGNKGSILDASKESIPVYLESGQIMVTASGKLTGSKLSGTPLNDTYQGYFSLEELATSRVDSLKNKVGKATFYKDTAALKVLKPRFKVLEKEADNAVESYFMAHNDSPASLDWLKSSVNLVQNKSKAIELFRKMSTRIKNSPNGIAYNKLLNGTPSAEVGSTAPDFTASNMEKKAFTLSSFRGKYVLLDFWASWCGPCRAENPNVLKAYNHYKTNNFTVVGLSIDDSESAWVKAVDKDALPWTQLLDKTAARGLVSLKYGITSIPTNFLIDPQGKIIATNLRGEALEKALAKLFKG